MMNDSMNTLIVMAALAMLQEKGVVHAIAYMRDNGISTNEAFEVIEQYENMRDLAKQDKLK